MENNQSRQVSVLEPIGSAIEKTKQILFRPFDLTKWFVIGFSAWLATLGQHGGPNIPFLNKNHLFEKSQQTTEIDTQYEIQEGIQEARQFFLENMTMSIAIGVALFVLCLTIALLVSWFKSRAQFTYLDCVAKNKAEFFNPWKQYAKEGNSFFMFKLCLGFIYFIISSIVFVPAVFLALPIIKNGFASVDFLNISVTSLPVLVMIITGVLYVILGKFTIDFVVPVMYLRKLSVLKAWNVYIQLLSNFKGMFTLYILVSIGIFFIQMTFWISLGIISIYGACCCLIPCCFTVWIYLPYIGLVVTLPWYIWKRSYSALFLAQFGPEFDVFARSDSAVVEPTASVPPHWPD